MPQFTSWLALATFLLFHAVVPCLGDDGLPPAEVVLAKWEESSRKCQSLDANLTVFDYDPFNGTEPTKAYGRFYYEAPGIARYEVTEFSYWADNSPTASAVTIWKTDEVLTLSLDTRVCARWPGHKLQSYLTETHGTEDYERSWFNWLFGHSFFYRMQTPQRFLPLLVNIRATEVLADFNVIIERKDDDILIKATPKMSPSQCGYSEVAILLGPTDYLPRATQVVNPNGRDRVVHVLHDLKVNQRPHDRDKLLSPDLSAFRVIEGF